MPNKRKGLASVVGSDGIDRGRGYGCGNDSSSEGLQGGALAHEAGQAHFPEHFQAVLQPLFPTGTHPGDPLPETLMSHTPKEVTSSLSSL